MGCSGGGHRLHGSPRALVWTLSFTVTEMTGPRQGFEQGNDTRMTYCFVN